MQMSETRMGFEQRYVSCLSGLRRGSTSEMAPVSLEVFPSHINPFRYLELAVAEDAEVGKLFVKCDHRFEKADVKKAGGKYTAQTSRLASFSLRVMASHCILQI